MIFKFRLFDAESSYSDLQRRNYTSKSRLKKLFLFNDSVLSSCIVDKSNILARETNTDSPDFFYFQRVL